MLTLIDGHSVANAVDRAEMTHLLNQRRINGERPRTGQMVQLFTPDGLGDVIVTRPFADSFCDSHAGWTWEAV